MRDPIADLMDLGFTEAHATLQSDRLQAAFAQIDRRVIAAMSDTELAVWHASFPIESPQAKLAEHEWQRRLTVMQVGAMRFATWVGLVGMFIGVLLGAVATYTVNALTKEVPQKAERQKADSDTKPTIQGPILAPESKASQVIRPKESSGSE